jgi:hypothetical protein
MGKEKLVEPKHLLWLAGLICLWLIIAAVLPQQSTPQERNAFATIKVFAGSEPVFEKQVEVATGTNGFEAIQASGLEFEYTDYGEMGVFIESIEGIKPRPDEFWKLLVNGKEAQSGISSIAIDKNTLIEWKIEKMQAYTQ